MKKIVKLKESDLVNIIKRVVKESKGGPIKHGKTSPFNPKESYEEMDEGAAVAPSWCQPPCQYVQNLDTWRYICVNDKGYPCSTKTK
jgi:hypothetical protein